MTFDFTCQKCDSSFELDAQDLIDGSEKLQCPNCDAKASTASVDDFVAAFVELRTQVAALSKKFAVTMAIETEDLEVADADDEDEDEDIEDEDEDLDDDEDEDLDDDEEALDDDEP